MNNTTNIILPGATLALFAASLFLTVEDNDGREALLERELTVRGEVRGGRPVRIWVSDGRREHICTVVYSGRPGRERSRVCLHPAVKRGLGISSSSEGLVLGQRISGPLPA